LVEQQSGPVTQTWPITLHVWPGRISQAIPPSAAATQLSVQQSLLVAQPWPTSEHWVAEQSALSHRPVQH
jgi:hypothetical protein